MKLAAIAAASENNVIGIDNDLPWHLPDDFQFFKNKTINKPIIMGKHTWYSFPKPLPNRLNIVISKSITDKLPDDVLHYHNITDALDYLSAIDTEEAFIIGGGMVYASTLQLVDTIYLTRVHTHIANGTAFFPEIDKEVWQLQSETHHDVDERHKFSFTFQVWTRR